jgi:hypothetical protein
MEDGIRDLRALLQAQLRDVFEQARDLGNRYLQEIVEANTAKGWNQKNRLKFRVRQRGNAIALEWYLINWYGRNRQPDLGVMTFARLSPKILRSS